MFSVQCYEKRQNRLNPWHHKNDLQKKYINMFGEYNSIGFSLEMRYTKNLSLYVK